MQARDQLLEDLEHPDIQELMRWRPLLAPDRLEALKEWLRGLCIKED
jgi:hypothetical protein